MDNYVFAGIVFGYEVQVNLRLQAQKNKIVR
jgi:hypothetical protein